MAKLSWKYLLLTISLIPCVTFGQIVYVGKNGKVGYKINGKIIIQPKFDWGYDFREGLAVVCLNNKCGFIDRSGNYVIPPIYDDAGSFSSKEGLAMVLSGGKYGYIRKDGKFEINPFFDYASNFKEGLAVVKLNGKFGFIDKTGAYIIPAQFESANSFEDGLGQVYINGKWHYIDNSCNIYTTDDKATALQMMASKQLKKDAGNQKSTKVRKFYSVNGKCGLRDENGNIVIEAIYGIGDFKEGLAFIKKDGRYGYVNEYGKIVIPLQYQNARDFSEGLAAVKQNNKYGYIDNTGKFVLPMQYEAGIEFKEGLAAVKVNNKFGFIDKSGKWVIDPLYGIALGFKEGLARVFLNGEWFYIDRKGNRYINDFNQAKRDMLLK